MAVTLVQSKQGNGTPSPGGPTFDDAPTPGNRIFLLWAGASSDAPDDGDDVFGAFVDSAALHNGFRLWTREVEPGDPALWAGTWGSGDWIMAEVSGLDASGPIGGLPLATFSEFQGPDSHPHQAISPVHTGEVMVLGAILHINTTLADFDPDAGYSWVETRQIGSGDIFGLLFRVDAANAGAYDPGASTLPFSGGWAAAALAWAGADDGEPPPPPTEYEPPDVPPAILEIYVNDPLGDKWDVAEWDVAEWSGAGWVSITPWAISADVTFGATRAESGILHDQEPASWNVETWDPDRVLDPSNEESQFAGQLVPGLPIRLSAGGRVIRTGQCDRIWYSHRGKGGRIFASDAISRLANVRVPEDTILSDTLQARSMEAIAAAGLDVDASWPIYGGDPALSTAPSGDFSAWAIIARASREVLTVPYIDKDDRLRWRRWSSPLRRGSVVASPELLDLTTWTSFEGLYGVVRVLDDGTATVIERRATPLPSYGEKVYERTDNTINGDTWAEAVLADRRDQSLRYVPGDIRPLDAESVDRLASLQIMEDITIQYTEADPPVLVASRILGVRVTAVDETRVPGEVRTRWRWRLITTLVSVTPLTEDGDSSTFLVADQDATQFLYPDGVSGL